MHISIRGHHISVTPALAASVIDKLACIERHCDQVQSLHVMLLRDSHHSSRNQTSSPRGHQRHKAEAILRLPGGELFASACADSMYVSIAQLAHKLDRQLIRHKQRH